MREARVFLSGASYCIPLSEAVFLVMCDPSVNELWATWTHRDIYICIDLSRSLTARSQKGHTGLKIQHLALPIYIRLGQKPYQGKIAFCVMTRREEKKILYHLRRFFFRTKSCRAPSFSLCAKFCITFLAVSYTYARIS